jgi:hypothetical protein
MPHRSGLDELRGCVLTNCLGDSSGTDTLVWHTEISGVARRSVRGVPVGAGQGLCDIGIGSVRDRTIPGRRMVFRVISCDDWSFGMSTRAAQAML